jgi:hypothetical protein
VHEHADAQLRPERLGHADVVEVCVSQDHRRDVCPAPAERRQTTVELRPVPWRARVDDRNPAVLCDEVPVDELRAETDDAVGDDRRFGCSRKHGRNLAWVFGE